ncbi:MAG TPA: T9SS type A sorting domain-containing protein [Bacteroidia bacterium]|jgi:hypothetical protein
MYRFISRKHLVLICFSGLFITASYSQSIGDYQSTGTGSWNVNATWQKCVTAGTWAGATNVFPPIAGATGTITILPGHVITIGINVVNTASIIISGTATLQTAATRTLTNSASGIITNNGTLINSSTLTTGIIINNGTIANNAVFTNNGTFNNNLTLNNATGATITQNGTAFTCASTGTINNFGTITISAAKTLTVTGMLSNSGTVNTTGTLTFTTTGYYKHNFSNLSAATGTIPTATWGAGTTCEILACGNSGSGPAGLTQNFRNFIWNNTAQPGDIYLLGSLQTIGTNFTMNSTNGYNLILKSSAAGSNLSVSGNLIFNNGKLIVNNILSGAAVNPVFSVGGNFSMLAGTLTVSNASGTGGGNGNGQFTVTGTSVITGGTINISTSTWIGPGGYGTFSGTGLITLSGGTINIASGATTATSGCGGTLNANGGLTITSGNLELTSSTVTSGGGNGILNIGGAFTHTGGTVSKSGPNSGTININGSISQAIESIGFSPGHIIPFNISQSGAGTTNIPALKTFVLNPGTTFTVNPNLGVADFTVNGTFKANTNSWLCDVGSVTNFSTNGIFINNVTTSISANSDTSSLIFEAASTFIVNADGGEIATAKWHAASTLQVNGIITATSIGNSGQSFGQILWDCASQTASTELGATGFGTQGSYTISNTGSGTLRFPDIDFSIGTVSTASNFLIVQNASRLQISNGANLYATGSRIITVWGHVYITGSASVSVGSPTTGTGSFASGSDQSKDFTLLLKQNFIFDSSVPWISYIHRSFASFGDESYRLNLNFAGTTQSITMPAVASTLVNVAGDFVVNSGSDDEFHSNNIYRLEVGSTSTLTNSGFVRFHELQINPGGTFTLAADLTQYALLSPSGATDNPSTVVNGTSTAVFGTIDFGLFLLSDASGAGTFTLNNFGKIKTKNILGLTSSGTTGSVQVTGARTYSSAGHYLYNNTTTAQVTGNGLPATITNALEIQSLAPATGGVTLTQATSITSTSGRLILTAGRLITSTANLITIGSGSVVSPVGGAATRYVDGPIKKIGNTAFIFPTGDRSTISKWARLAITAPSVATDAFTAEYIFVNPHTAVGSVYGTGITDISHKEYWKVTRAAGTSTPSVTLYWELGTTVAAGSGIFSIASTDLRVAEHYSGQWNDHGSGSTTGTTALGTITTGVVPSFTTGTEMPFTLMAPNSVNPLPVELTSFTGVYTTSGNRLDWSTSSETNNDHFEIERSLNGNDFNYIASIEGQGNTTSKTDYSYIDSKPERVINYYRLKQVDQNGEFTYSNIIAIDNNAGGNEFLTVYPNPTSGEVVTISGSENISLITIYNILGEVVYNTGILADNKVTVTILSKGNYFVKAVTTDNNTITSRFTRY